MIARDRLATALVAAVLTLYLVTTFKREPEVSVKKGMNFIILNVYLAAEWCGDKSVGLAKLRQLSLIL